MAIGAVVAVAGIAALAVSLSGSSTASSGSTSSSITSSTASSAVSVTATRIIEAETTYATTTFPNGSSSAVTIVNGSQSGGPNPYGPCSIAGQPAGFLFRILSNSSSAPVIGANVTARHFEASVNCDGSLFPGDTTIAHFQTDGSLWYSLDSSNAGFYNLTMTYEGHQYPSMIVPMYPVTLTLVTVDLPSGAFSVDVRTYGANDNYSGPSAISSFGNLSLKMTLANSSVKAGQFLPIRVELVGPGAWNASYGFQTLRVTNATGTVVFNATGRIPSLSPMTYTSALQDFVFSNGWNANYYPEPAGVTIQPGQYGVTISVEVAGHLFVTTQAVQVVA